MSEENPGVEVLTSAAAFTGALSNVRVDRVRFADGSEADREIVEHPDAVGIVALDADGKVLMLRQYRHAVGERLLELPAGKLDVRGEDPVAAARRELQEETGYRAGRMDHLLRFHNSAGWTDEATTLYLAEGLEEAGVPVSFTAQHEEADMEVEWVPLDEAVSMVASGEIRDAKSIIGVLMTRLQRGVH